MTKQEKQKEIHKLKTYIDELMFKIEASKLKLKFAKDVSDTLAIAWQNVYYAMQIKITYAQIQSIIAIPNHLKGGIAICGEERPEVIIRK